MKKTKRIVRNRRKMKGKRVIAGILLAEILAVTLAGCKNIDNTREETEKPVITLGSDNYPPYNYLNEDGEPTGIDVELATEAFKRMGYQVDVVQINWEKKKELVESGEIDCIMGCFSMEGRLDDYRWAGPYIASRQVVAVNESSDIYKLSDLEGKNLAVQSTTKPEGIFLDRMDERIPKLGNLISLGHWELIYTFLGKRYVDGAVSRGLKKRKILFGYVLQNALVTIITLMSMSIGSLLGGTAAIEMLFVMPGMGYMVTSAVTSRDYPVIQGFVVWMSVIYIFINLLTDIAYYYLDPRIGAEMEVD